MADNFGPLSNVVAGAGTLIAAAGALSVAWKGRSRWEPSEEDVPAGPQKVGGLLAATGLVLIWAEYHSSPTALGLRVLLAVLAVLTLGSLGLYSFLISNQTFDVVRAPSGTAFNSKIIGGFHLTLAAQEIAKKGTPVNDILKGMAYDPDKVWTRASRSAAKLLFVLGYIALTVSGTLAIGSGAIVLSGTVVK